MHAAGVPGGRPLTPLHREPPAHGVTTSGLPAPPLQAAGVPWVLSANVGDSRTVIVSWDEPGEGGGGLGATLGGLMGGGGGRAEGVALSIDHKLGPAKTSEETRRVQVGEGRAGGGAGAWEWEWAWEWESESSGSRSQQEDVCRGHKGQGIRVGWGGAGRSNRGPDGRGRGGARGAPSAQQWLQGVRGVRGAAGPPLGGCASSSCLRPAPPHGLSRPPLLSLSLVAPSRNRQHVPAPAVHSAKHAPRPVARPRPRAGP